MAGLRAPARIRSTRSSNASTIGPPFGVDKYLGEIRYLFESNHRCYGYRAASYDQAEIIAISEWCSSETTKLWSFMAQAT
jgi:hypothetical protein